MVFDSLKLGQQTEGFWGAHTASIDWCEDNYTTSRYIAEFFNTTSNIPFIGIGFYGWWRAMQTGLPQKYALPLLGLSVIGAGSAGFHATLRWDWQLMDELPMIYEVMLCNLLVWDVDKRWGVRGVAAMLAFDVWHTASYVTVATPIFHQLAFAGLQVATVGRIIYLTRNRLPPSAEHPARANVYWLINTGVAIFFCGFLIWNIDNLFCVTLQNWRAKIEPFGFLLECHGWWHLFSGVGAYYLIQGAMYLGVCITTHPDAYDIKWDFLPYIIPNPNYVAATETAQQDVKSKNEKASDL